MKTRLLNLYCECCGTVFTQEDYAVYNEHGRDGYLCIDCRIDEELFEKNMCKDD